MSRILGKQIFAVGALLGLTGCLQAAEQTLTRNGQFWVETTTGSERIAPDGRLRVSTRGQVGVEGASGDRLRYVFTRTVRAGSESEARRLLGRPGIQTVRSNEWNLLQVIDPGERYINLNLQVTVPRGLSEVAVETFGGAVEVSGLKNTLQAFSGGGGIRLDQIGGPVQAKTLGGEIILGTIAGFVSCVSAGGPIRATKIGGGAQFETGGGDIVVDEVGGSVSASTAGGGIHIHDAGGDVNVNTAGGGIEIGRARGMVVAENRGGPIQVGSAAGVRCQSGGGMIRLTNVSGALRASTEVGSVFAALLAGAMMADSSLTTGSGDITVLLPSNLGITIQAQNEAAYNLRRIVSDFPAVRIRRRGSSIVAEGAINGGGPLLRLSSTGGVIYIRRQH
jgi:hypothetical protein